MGDKKGNVLVVILSILALIGLTTTGYFYWKTQTPKSQTAVNPTKTTPVTDETANWKTYTNEKYGFTFKYPSNWIISYQGKNEISDLLLSFAGPDIKNYDPINFSLRENFTIQDEIKSLNKNADAFGSKVLSTENLLIGNNKYTVITYSTAEGTTPTEIAIGHGGNVYSFFGSAFGSQNKNLNQILSTFKFIDSKSFYVCPRNGWVNCMPILDEAGKKACSGEAMVWYKNNCPGFKGAAL